MNKAEIIRKISKKAGVPDTEAKKFFEIFLKNASDILKPGESLMIPEVGLFQLRVGQIENRTIKQAGDNFIYSDLIVFINEEGGSPEEAEEIIFNVPSGLEEEYQPVDSYFSLSIGKPIIPLKGVVESEFFIPPSGSELRGLIESKIERLLEEAVKVEGGKETETIHLKPEEEMSDESSDWKILEVENSPEDIRVPSRSDFLKTREFENLSWDFGENLSQEIEEESVPDTGQEYEEYPEAEENYVNEPGKITGEQDETGLVFEEEIDIDDTPYEGIFEEITDEEADSYEDFKEEATKTEQETEAGEIKDEIKVKSHEPEIIQDVVNNEIQDQKEKQEIPFEEPESEEPSLKNFQRVKSLTKEFNSTEFNDAEEIEEERPKKITEVRGGYQKVRRTTAEFDFDLSGIEGLDEIEEPPPEKKKSAQRDYQGYRKHSNLPSLIIALVVVIALGILIFLYMKMKSVNNETTKGNTSAVTKQETTVIDRDYDVPVTYPYEKSGQKSTSELKENGKEQAADKDNSTGTEAPVEKKETDLSEIRNPVNAKRIGNYIYQYPEGIVVQVSSWKSKSIALSEVKKYRNAGYTAFAEMSTISGMGLYYRIRVGYFNSSGEAENFLKRK